MTEINLLMQMSVFMGIRIAIIKNKINEKYKNNDIVQSKFNLRYLRS